MGNMKFSPIWAYQPKDYGLGNFINITPTLKKLYLEIGEPIPTYFESEYIRELFKDEYFIRAIDKKPENAPFVSSSEINPNIPDWEYVFRKRWQSKVPNTHAPIIKTAVILNGCANETKRQFKDPGKEIYQQILRTIRGHYYIWFVGSGNDWRNFTHSADLCDNSCINDIRGAAAIIRGADIVIGNDTGLYHLAGAMEKKGFIMWKDTKFMKNKSPNPNFFHSHQGNWRGDFDRWADGI